LIFFFFQAEDGIRDKLVTGVQTCALPILGAVYNNLGQTELSEQNRQKAFELRDRASEHEKLYIMEHYYVDSNQLEKGKNDRSMRSEERRVGKECRSRGWRYQ